MKSAMPILMAMKGGSLLDELGAKIAAVSSTVNLLNKPGEVTLKIKISPYKQGGAKLVEQPLVYEVGVTVKEPDPDRHADLYWLDDDGYPQTQPVRQEKIDFGPRVVAHNIGE
jgi:hypothetical protein